MDGTPVHQRHHAHTLSHLVALRITKPSTIMFLGDGRKPEKSKETNTTPGEHSKLHIDSSSGSNWPVLAILKMSERTSMASDGSQYSYCKKTNKQKKANRVQFCWYYTWARSCPKTEVPPALILVFVHVVPDANDKNLHTWNDLN